MKRKILYVLAFLVIISISGLSLFSLLKSVPNIYNVFLFYRYPLKYQEYILKYSAQYSVDPYLVMAVIYEESRFRPDSTSGKGALGLMQVLPETAQYISQKIGDKDFSPGDILDIEKNIQYGSYYLSYLSGKYPDLDKVLAAYNAGEGNVDLWIEEGDFDIKFKETDNFVERVKNTKTYYERLYPSERQTQAQ